MCQRYSGGFSLNRAVIISRLLWIFPAVTIVLSMLFYSQSEHFRDWPFFVSESDRSGPASLIFTVGFMLSGVSLSLASWMMWADKETITQYSVENISRISGIVSGICLCGLALFDMYEFTLIHVIFASTLFCVGCVWMFTTHKATNDKDVKATSQRLLFIWLGGIGWLLMTVSMIAATLYHPQWLETPLDLSHVQSYVAVAAIGEYLWAIAIIGSLKSYEEIFHSTL